MSVLNSTQCAAATCKKEVSIDGLGSALSQGQGNGTKVFFCSENCRQIWLDQRNEDLQFWVPEEQCLWNGKTSKPCFDTWFGPGEPCEYCGVMEDGTIAPDNAFVTQQETA